MKIKFLTILLLTGLLFSFPVCCNEKLSGKICPLYEDQVVSLVQYGMKLVENNLSREQMVRDLGLPDVQREEPWGGLSGYLLSKVSGDESEWRYSGIMVTFTINSDGMVVKMAVK